MKESSEYLMRKAKIVKDLVNTFNVNPLSNNDNLENFYVDTSEARGEDTAAKLAYLLKNDDTKNKKFLFAGHSGSGKSTELYKLTEKLKDDYFVICFSIADYVDFLDVSFVDIVFTILKNMVDEAQRNNIDIDETILKSIHSYWEEEKIITTTNEENSQIGVESKAGISLANLLSTKIMGLLQSSSKVKKEAIMKLERKIPILIELMNEFIDDLKSKLGNKELLIIVDDLDKLAEEEAIDIFKKHCKFLVSINSNIIYTFPVFMHYIPDYRYIEINFDESLILSIIMTNTSDGNEYTKGRNTLEEIIKKRADESLFEKDCIKYAIEKSGGCIRDIMRFIRTAAMEADIEYIKNKPDIPEENRKVSMKDIQKAYRGHKNVIQKQVNQDNIPILKQIHKTKKAVVGKENKLLMDLFKTLAVIEYNCERWCDLNPAVRDYLIEIKEIEIQETEE